MLLAVLPETKSQGLFHQIHKEVTFCGLPHGAYAVSYTHLVIALGAGLGVWGVVNLLEGYGSDNPGAKSQGMKQLMAGGGIIVLGTTLIPLLSTLF